MIDIGKRIKQLRKSHDMNQNDLAEQLHVAISTVSNWENGRNQVSPDYYQSLANIFNISVPDFLSVENYQKTTPTHLSSKPYISYQYKLNTRLWIPYGLVMILSFLSPIWDNIIEDLMMLSWLLLLLISLSRLINNYKQNISTKFFEDNQLLYYEHQDSDQKMNWLKRQYLLFLVMLWFSLNIVILFAFGYILNNIDDLFTLITFPITLLISNIILIYSFFVDSNKKFKSRIIDYQAISINFFLARNKLLLIVYTFVYIFYYSAVNAFDLNPYKEFGMIILGIIMILVYIAIFMLYEMNQYFYSKYRIKVK